MIKSLLLFHIDKPIFGNGTFFGSYGVIAASWFHLIPSFFGIVGAITGGITGIIILTAQIYNNGGFRGVWYKIKHLWEGDSPKSL
jgi:hypothetical protein